jgi:hypothetical protein
MYRRRLAKLCLLVVAALPAAANASDFDPQRHMRASEVRPGMKGYGLSVFSGQRIDRFEVEVISTLRNFSPRQDVVLIRVSGCNLEHTGAIAGMSGSPIYLRDEQGRERLMGAFAYGWPMMKDPIAGVQPIEYMLSMPLEHAPATTQHAGAAAGEGAVLPGIASVGLGAVNGRAAWSVADALAAARRQMQAGPSPEPLPRVGSRLSLSDTALPADPTRLRPLQTPLMVSGLSFSLMQPLAPALANSGLVMLQAGGTTDAGNAKPSAAGAERSAAGTEPARDKSPFAPGSVMAVPLLTGDVEMTAVGTCTEVIADRVYGFGHPFTSEGPVRLPMGSGSIQGIIANLVTSFKLGALTEVQGTLLADRSPGVGGRIGEAPPRMPITCRVRYTDDAAETVFRYHAAMHPRFTPLLAAVALAGSVTAGRELPALNTVDYSIKVSFPGGRTIELSDRAANAEAGHMVMEVSLPLLVAAANPFERVLPEKIEGSVTVTPGTQLAQIIRAQTAVRRCAPGDHVRVNVTLRQFRGAEVVKPVEITIPKDLPDGDYQLAISGKNDYVAMGMALEPYRMMATNIDDVFAVLGELGKLRSDAIYARLTLQPEGTAIGRTPLPRLPASHKHVLAAAGRSDITGYTLTRTVTVPTEFVVQGSASFQLSVDRKAGDDTAPRSLPRGAAPAGRTESRPQASMPELLQTPEVETQD